MDGKTRIPHLPHTRRPNRVQPVPEHRLPTRSLRATPRVPSNKRAHKTRTTTEARASARLINELKQVMLSKGVFCAPAPRRQQYWPDSDHAFLNLGTCPSRIGRRNS